MDDPHSIDELLSAMTPRVPEPTWEDKGMALLSEFKQEWRENPLNMTCMIIVGVLVFGTVFYGISSYFPSYNPAY
jgi:hypothetical protein